MATETQTIASEQLNSTFTDQKEIDNNFMHSFNALKEEATELKPDLEITSNTKSAEKEAEIGTIQYHEIQTFIDIIKITDFKAGINGDTLDLTNLTNP